MIYAFGMNQVSKIAQAPSQKPVLPRWIMGIMGSDAQAGGAKPLENAGFASGSALALLHMALHDPVKQVPSELLRIRMALRAAANCLKLQGRGETEGEIRDAYLLTQPDDEGVYHWGPGGDMLALWKKGVRVSLKRKDWQEKLCAILPEELRQGVEELLDVYAVDKNQNPVAAAITVLTTLIKTYPHEEACALLVADALLAHQLGWSNPIPLLGLTLKRSAFRSLLNDGDELVFKLSCYQAIISAAHSTIRLAHDLTRHADQLRAVAPKLRAKGSDDAVCLFLSEDAIFPTTMLSPVIKGTRTKMSDHAARRLCDRLVTLGVVKELTGRKTFRLYGVG